MYIVELAFQIPGQYRYDYIEGTAAAAELNS